jgi:nucleoside-diphosphate-sugar epimerase
MVTINQLWEIISKLSGYEMAPDYAASRPGDIRLSMADIEKAGRIFGFKPAHAFEEGIKATFEWYGQRGSHI